MQFSEWTMLGVAAAGGFGWLMCKIRSEVQGYFWDRFCTNSKLLHNKVAVVTGANSGLGLALSQLLIQRGAHVVMACRSKARSEGPLKTVQSAAKNGGSAELMILDLASPQSVESFAQEFQEKGLKLNYLICNAGIMGPSENTVTENGIELSFQANYLGHFQLVKLLNKQLQHQALEGEDTRVISVSSGAHFGGTIAWDDVNSVKSWTAYGQSKLAQVMHMKELQRRFEQAGCKPTNFRAVSLTPGAVRSNFLPMVYLLPLYPIVWFILRSATTGAQVILHCILDDSIVGGAFYSNLYSKPARGKNGIANDVKAQERLWNLSEDLLKKSQ